MAGDQEEGEEIKTINKSIQTTLKEEKTNKVRNPLIFSRLKLYQQQ